MREYLGQMIIARTTGHLFDQQIRYPQWEATNSQLQNWLENYNLGGVILLGGSAAELALKVEKLQTWAKTPLFIAADIEEGVGQRFAGATHFPPLMALGEIAKKNLPLALDFARQQGAITAQEALSIGINWILAPVVDVNNNPDNPVINIRSFADNPHLVARLSRAFLEGAQAFRVLTTAKHFPGHGDTSTDSHLSLPVLTHSLERLTSLELVPFQSAIASGVDSIMSAHLLIPAWDATAPVTLSYPILTELLRQKLGFQGLIITDALIMGGITQVAPPQEVVVRAIEAGADILLMPSEPVLAIEAIMHALETGRLTPQRIEESLERIAQAKAKLGASSRPNFEQLCQPQATALVGDILENSFLSNNISLQPQPGARNLLVVDDLLNCDFLDRQSPSIAVPKSLGYQLELVDQTTLKNVQSEQLTLLQIFIRANPFRGSAGLSEALQSLYQKLLESNNLQALIIYGSPYILEILKVPDLPWIFSYGQMAKSQALVFEKLLKSPQLYHINDKFVDN